MMKCPYCADEFADLDTHLALAFAPPSQAGRILYFDGRGDQTWKELPGCEECGGKGQYLDAPQNVLDGHPYWEDCAACGGTGYR